MKRFMILAFFLFAMGAMVQTAQAQLSVCGVCQTQVNTINQFDFGTGNGFKSIGFQANVSGSPFCQSLGMQWSTSYPNAQITQDGGPWARIDFPTSGPSLGGSLGGSQGNIAQVCCTYSLWRDYNQNGIQDAGEICENTLCINVNL